MTPGVEKPEVTNAAQADVVDCQLAGGGHLVVEGQGPTQGESIISLVARVVDATANLTYAGAAMVRPKPWMTVGMSVPTIRF